MEIELTDYKGLHVFSLCGEIDMHSSPALRKQLMSLVGRKVPVLLVNFAGVSYIDSSGIATFVEGLKGMMSYGGRLKLIGIPVKIVEVFTFSRLDKVFEIYRDLDDAVNS